MAKECLKLSAFIWAKDPFNLQCNQVSWFKIMTSQVYCGFMLFNMKPFKEREFLNFDCSVPSRRRIKHYVFQMDRAFKKCHPLSWGPHQVMDDDMIIWWVSGSILSKVWKVVKTISSFVFNVLNISCFKTLLSILCYHMSIVRKSTLQLN